MRKYVSFTAALIAATAILVACAQPAPPVPTAAPPTAAPAAPQPPPPTSAPTAVPTPTVRTGGELVFAVSDLPPSFDGHRETTFAMLHPVAPHYSTLLRFDSDNYPKVVGDLAESWTVSPDGLTYTFKIRSGVKFHDGSTLTSKDVKASYDKIIAPPTGVASARQATYANVDKVEVPDDATVVFRMKIPTPSMLTNLASPWNFIYKADLLAKDPRHYEKNVMGTGPFKFVEYVPGSTWVAKKNEDYFIKGRPYMDGYKAVFITDTAARVNAIRSGQALIEFRGFSPQDTDTLVRALGDKIVVQKSPWTCNMTVALNNEKKPFDNVNVRRALSMAIPRYEATEVLSKISIMGPVGGIFRPGSDFATPASDLEKLRGFGKNIEDARKEAAKLLRDNGVPEGSTFVLTNRNIPEPYEATGVYVIDQWRKIGLNVTHKPVATYTADLRAGNFEAAIDFACDFADEPDFQLVKFISTKRSPVNYARYEDKTLDELYDKQSRASDPKERLTLLREFEKRLLDDQAYQFHVLWWQRLIPHSTLVRGWKITPNHYVNQDLRDVWLAAAQ